jgi:hypothetical protein
MKSPLALSKNERVNSKPPVSVQMRPLVLVAEMKPVALTFVKSNIVASTFVTSRTTFVKKYL